MRIQWIQIIHQFLFSHTSLNQRYTVVIFRFDVDRRIPIDALPTGCRARVHATVLADVVVVATCAATAVVHLVGQLNPASNDRPILTYAVARGDETAKIL